MVKFETLTSTQQNITKLTSILLMFLWLLGGSYLVGHFSCPKNYIIGTTIVILGTIPVFVGSLLSVGYYFNERNRRR